MPQVAQTTRENPADARGSHPSGAQGHGAEDGRPGVPSGEEPGQPSETTSGSQYLPPAELADKVEDFTRVMQEKFCPGWTVSMWTVGRSIMMQRLMMIGCQRSREMRRRSTLRRTEGLGGLQYVVRRASFDHMSAWSLEPYSISSYPWHGRAGENWSDREQRSLSRER